MHFHVLNLWNYFRCLRKSYQGIRRGTGTWANGLKFGVGDVIGLLNIKICCIWSLGFSCCQQQFKNASKRQFLNKVGSKNGSWPETKNSIFHSLLSLVICCN